MTGYVMRFKGKVLPVMNMLTRDNKMTADPARAAKVVLKRAQDEWVATTCSPHELLPKIVGPDTRYMMQWRGEWRPVIAMADRQGTPTTLVIQAAIALLYLNPTQRASCHVNVGDIVERFDRDPDVRPWEYID